jgi:hypothetical protein
MLSEVDMLTLWHAQIQLQTSSFLSSFSRESDFTFTTVFVVKQGENGKGARRAGGNEEKSEEKESKNMCVIGKDRHKSAGFVCTR